MRNISVRIILAVLLVASLASAYVWDCKTEWPDVVRGLNPGETAEAFIEAVKEHHDDFVCGAYVGESNRIRRVAIEKRNMEPLMFEFSETDYGWIFRVFYWSNGEPLLAEYDENGIASVKYWPDDPVKHFYAIRRYFSRHIND